MKLLFLLKQSFIVLLLVLVAWPFSAHAEFRLPGLSPALHRLFTIYLMNTESGILLSRRILGAEAGLINKTHTDEILRTLAHPQNRALADELTYRLLPVELQAASRRLDRIPLEATWKEIPPNLRPWIRKQIRERLALAQNDHLAEVSFLHTRPGYPDRYRVFNAVYLNSEQTFFWQAKLHQIAPSRTVKSKPLLPAGVDPDPMAQFCYWETRANPHWPDAIETDQFVGIQIGKAPRNQVEVITTPETPSEIHALFVRPQNVMIPIAPYAAPSAPLQIPFFDAPRVEIWPGKLTSSRSTLFWDTRSGLAFSFKVPTNFPHRSAGEPSKTFLQTDITFGIARSKALAQVDQRLGPDPDYLILREVFALRDPVTKNGVLVRDIRPLQSGRYYMPFFSLGVEMPRIAKVVPEAYTEEYWLETVVRSVARAKARFLVRYGIQFDTPHDQNLILELDEAFRPTGRVIFRDVADSHLYSPYFKALNRHAETKRYFEWEKLETKDLKGDRPRSQLDPRNHYVSGARDNFREAMDTKTIVDWRQEHEWAYIEEVARLLDFPNPYSLSKLEQFLKSAEGQAAWRRFHGLSGP